MPKIFTFGSNTAGIHGAGAAKVARESYGAVYGQGVGRQGNAYAIPTKGEIVHQGRRNIGPPLPIEKIKQYVYEFIEYAKQNPKEEFQVTAIGTGHAGYTHEQIAPLFADAPDNCQFDTAWEPFLGDEREYWGHA